MCFVGFFVFCFSRVSTIVFSAGERAKPGIPALFAIPNYGPGNTESCAGTCLLVFEPAPSSRSALFPPCFTPASLPSLHMPCCLPTPTPSCRIAGLGRCFARRSLVRMRPPCPPPRVEEVRVPLASAPPHRPPPEKKTCLWVSAPPHRPPPEKKPDSACLVTCTASSRRRRRGGGVRVERASRGGAVWRPNDLRTIATRACGEAAPLPSVRGAV